MTPFDPYEIREDFPILSRQVHGRPLIYLDSGATAQKPRAVIERMDEIYFTLNANVHRGVHYLSEQCTEAYEAAREEVRRFINASSREEIIFTAGATAAINTVAFTYGERFIRPGDNVVITAMEHHSNIVPWQLVCDRQGAELRVLPFDEHGRLEEEKLPGLIDERTRLIAVTQASNVLGTRPTLDLITKTAYGYDIPVLVDGCQGIVHGGVDVQKMDCDFYAFSGHKLFGPTGIGVLYGKREWLEKLPPFMGGGDMVGTVSFERTTYAELPLRFEAGTANYVGAIGLGEAIKYVSSLDRHAVAAHEEALLERATRRLLAIDGVRIYGDQPGKCSIVSFTAEGAHPYDIGMILDKLGIAIRTGTHCAEPLMRQFGVDSMCRASMAMYNTVEEIDALADGVERALRMLRR